MDEVFELLQKANGWVILICGGGISGILKLILNQIKLKNQIRKQEKEAIDKRFKLMERANLAILHNKVYRQCAEHLDAGFITIDDLDDLEYLFSAYKMLGGNGTGETIYNKVKNLPNKKMEDIS